MQVGQILEDGSFHPELHTLTCSGISLPNVTVNNTFFKIMRYKLFSLSIELFFQLRFFGNGCVLTQISFYAVIPLLKKSSHRWCV